MLNNGNKILCILNEKKTKFLPVSRFQFMTRVAQYHMVDLYSRSQDYKLNWQKHNQKLIFGKDENLIFGKLELNNNIGTLTNNKKHNMFFKQKIQKFIEVLEEVSGCSVKQQRK